MMLLNLFSNILIFFRNMDWFWRIAIIVLCLLLAAYSMKKFIKKNYNEASDKKQNYLWLILVILPILFVAFLCFTII